MPSRTFIVVLLILLQSCCNFFLFVVSSYNFTKDELVSAVQAWTQNQVWAIDTYGHISTWDVSHVTDMSYLFYNSNFNDDISSWNTSSVRTMYAMFYYTWAFNQPLDSWKTNLVTDMGFMFANSAFNQTLGSWNTSDVFSMYAMFHYNHAFNQPLDSWDMSNVFDLSFMFYYATSYGYCLPWDVSEKSTYKWLEGTNGATSGNCHGATMNPTRSPVICQEKDTKKFLLTVRRNEQNVVRVNKTCRWLRKQSPERIANICSRAHGRKDAQAAKDACKKTCGSCFEVA